MGRQIRANCSDNCLNCKVIPLTQHEWAEVHNIYTYTADTDQKRNAYDVMRGNIVKVACEQRNEVIWVKLV